MVTITIDELVGSDRENVRRIINETPLRRTQGERAVIGTDIYKTVHAHLNIGARNTPEQVSYLSAYETAVSVYRQASKEIRTTMDILAQEILLETRVSQLNKADIPKDEQDESNAQLRNRITDGIVYSNKYALAFAGRVGLAMIDQDVDPDNKQLLLLRRNDAAASKDIDAIAKLIIGENASNVDGVLLKVKAEIGQLTDEHLRLALRGIFTSWVNQYTHETFKDITQQYGLEDMTVKFGNYSVRDGDFRTRASRILVDDRIMNVRRKDVIGNEDFVERLRRNVTMVLAYDHERKLNPFPAPMTVMVIAPPGCGKTMTAHATMREAEEEARRRNKSLWLKTHSTTDYANKFKDDTPLQLNNLAMEIRNFPGPVIMYTADADAIFGSRNNAHTTPEEQKTYSVYFKMYDGTLIPKNGKFLSINDANYIHGIDAATKDRLFGEVIEMGRFKTADEFARYVRETLTKGADPAVIEPNGWLEIGEYLLGTTLSHRAIGHVVTELRGGFSLDIGLLDKTFEEQEAHVKAHLRSFTKTGIMDSFQKYITTRQKIDEESERAATDEQYRMRRQALRMEAKLAREVSEEAFPGVFDRELGPSVPGAGEEPERT